MTRYQGSEFRYRTVFVVHTDNGLEGLGEHVGKVWEGMDDWIKQLRGTNPCDWLAHPALPIALAPAIYDLVGKYNDVPAYKLFGPQVRARVPMAAWTVSQTPQKMAEEVEHAAAAGYTWLKFHTFHCHNVIAQTEAMQAKLEEVAPPGFKIHYDINFDNTVEHVLDLARELIQFPVAGAIEDPLRTHDFEGYRALRKQVSIAYILPPLAVGRTGGTHGTCGRLHAGARAPWTGNSAGGTVRSGKYTVHDAEHRWKHYTSVHRTYGVGFPNGNAAPRHLPPIYGQKTSCHRR